jgi:hypothetical protein
MRGFWLIVKVAVMTFALQTLLIQGASMRVFW